MSRVFLDTNVLIDYVRGKPGPHLDKIQALMENFVNRIDSAVITSLVIAELRTTIRKQAVLRAGKSLPDGTDLTDGQKATVLAQADELANEVIEDLLRSRRIVQLRDPSYSSSVLLRKALDIVEHNHGDAWIQNTCEVCKASPVRFVNYRYINSADAIHASCASALNCEIFATGERSFRALNGSADLPGLDFKVIE
jgi:predicted nucleic acid-binding protein